MAPRYYSIRRLSPFQGTLQVAKTDNGRGLSLDGVNWHVQARCEARRPRWGHLQAEVVLCRYASFGIWSKKHGLTRVPVDPTLEVACLHDGAEQVMAALDTATDAVPFPLADPVELWLLDHETKRPLALMASALMDRPLPHFRKLEWLPSLLNDVSLAVPGIAAKARTLGGAWANDRRHEGLRKLISRATGTPARAQWFHRQEDRCGKGLTELNSDGTLKGRQLVADEFPELPLREAWPRPEEQRLVTDYHDWQAPLLLTLAGMTDCTRHRLERAACRQPMLVRALHRLYPRILNKDLFNKALVEAVIRQTNVG